MSGLFKGLGWAELLNLPGNQQDPTSLSLYADEMTGELLLALTTPEARGTSLLLPGGFETTGDVDTTIARKLTEQERAALCFALAAARTEDA